MIFASWHHFLAGYKCRVDQHSIVINRGAAVCTKAKNSRDRRGRQKAGSRESGMVGMKDCLHHYLR